MPRRSSTSATADKNQLDARGQAILAAIIKEHLVTGEAVGSRVLSDRFEHGTGWSSATIRNVMSVLEDSGLVEQPHTSAGRLPTDKGYRYYVDHMLGEAKLSEADLKAIDDVVYGDDPDSEESPDRLMERASHALSLLSENVGIIISPSLAENRLKHIEFVQLADKRVLVVLVSSSNIIHNKLIRLDDVLSQDDLDRAARYLNTEFSGKSLMTIRARILELMSEEKALYDRLLRNAIMLCDMSLEGDAVESPSVYVDGASNILTKPGFLDVERMRALFQTFEEKSRLIKILNECISRDTAAAGNVHIVIGREHLAPSMQNCALITTPYRVRADEGIGTIGVVGPMRIEYSRMMAMVNYMARLIERRLTEQATP
ncbi:MAG TPA: heat-inducible transcriptional repressor HrcA [Pyrinomonadaceae bacterium]|jgi:heat-inducible transcriptional repressor|nr:heat-inducible transcriptional repressor HrcA [Pyrinomonadaceae bacterium]